MKKKDFLIDYCSYILLKVIGPLFRLLPPETGSFLGRRMGEVFFVLDLKHRALAYAHIKTALGDSLTPRQIRGAVLDFYRNFGQNMSDIFYIPGFNKEYLRRYISIDGLEHVREGFSRGKGVIFVAVHAGSWEMANIICANLGFPFSMFVRTQKFPRVEDLLNYYRGAKGCRFIQRENDIRELIRVLKANESVVMTVDQGGKNGTDVEFFGKSASLSSGAVRLALKLDCALIPVFPVRENGPHIKFLVEPVFRLRSTGNFESDVRDNLQDLAGIFQKRIAQYPKEYLWTYKTWKYSRHKEILILSDGKTGHLRQSQALAGLCVRSFAARGITGIINTAEVRFRNGFSARAMTLANCFSGKYACQGCMFCLRSFLDPASYSRLARAKPDVVISCGSSLAAVNFRLCREGTAKSLVIMRPSIFSFRRFDLVVMPRHDRPANRKNVAIIDGALNLVDRDYLKEQSGRLLAEAAINIEAGKPVIGLLLGGSTKDFRLEESMVKDALDSLKAAGEKLDCRILATTSRRTPAAVEALVKNELSGYPRAKLVIIANEKNYPSAVGGILGLSDVVVVSPESISMISEAVGSLKHVVVFRSAGGSARHRLFLDNLARGGYIHLAEAGELAQTIERILSAAPEARLLKDNQVITEALRRIL